MCSSRLMLLLMDAILPMVPVVLFTLIVISFWYLPIWGDRVQTSRGPILTPWSRMLDADHCKWRLHRTFLKHFGSFYDLKAFVHLGVNWYPCDKCEWIIFSFICPMLLFSCLIVLALICYLLFWSSIVLVVFFSFSIFQLQHSFHITKPDFQAD